MYPKVLECFHKIVQLQAHKGCYQLASICEKECQKLHGDVIVMSIDAVDDQFKAISQLLYQEINKNSTKLDEIYNEMINQLQRQRKDNLRTMEGELLAALIKSIGLEKSVFDKVENKRYERIKCHELITFMEESNIQEKIQQSEHTSIYKKYEENTLQFRELFFKFSSQINQSRTNRNSHSGIFQISQPAQGKGSTLLTHNQPSSERVERSKHLGKPRQSLEREPSEEKQRSELLDTQLAQEQRKCKGWESQCKALEKSNQQKNDELRKRKYELRKVETDKANLVRKLGEKVRRVSNLKVKTWNIFRVVSRKIKKDNRAITIEDEVNSKPVEQQEPVEQPQIEESPEMVDSSEHSPPSQHSQPDNQFNHEVEAEDIPSIPNILNLPLPQVNSHNQNPAMEQELPQKIPPIQLQQTRPYMSSTVLQNQPEINNNCNLKQSNLHPMIPEEVIIVEQQQQGQLLNSNVMQPERNDSQDKSAVVIEVPNQTAEVDSIPVVEPEVEKPETNEIPLAILDVYKDTGTSPAKVTGVSPTKDTRVSPAKEKPEMKESIFGFFSRLSKNLQ